MMSEVLEAGYATEEHYDRPPLSLQPYDILREHPHGDIECAKERPAFEQAHQVVLQALFWAHA